MLLAQIKEGADVAKQLIETSNSYGFAALALMVLYLSIVVGAVIHFVKVVCPERDARIAAHCKLAECMTTMTEQDIRQTALLEQQATWNGKIDSKLSDIKDIAGASKCEARNLSRTTKESA